MKKLLLYALTWISPIWNERLTDYGGRFDTLFEVYGEWSYKNIIFYGIYY